MIVAALIIFGVCLGSFINALVWRLYQNGVGLDTAPKKAQKQYSILRGRSMCVHCKHQLGWYDLLPVVSWLLLGGKCRYCKKAISYQYPLVEVAAALLFVLSYIYWPHGLDSPAAWIAFMLWLGSILVSLALAVYDLRWMILPTKMIYVFAGFGLAFVAAQQASEGGMLWRDALIGCIAYGGVFWLLHEVSKGKWIGGGDVRLGFALGVLLGWQHALLSLVLASYLGSVVFLFLKLRGAYKKGMRIPFGPLLLAGAFTAMIWGQDIIDWYLRFSGY